MSLFALPTAWHRPAMCERSHGKTPLAHQHNQTFWACAYDFKSCMTLYFFGVYRPETVDKSWHWLSLGKTPVSVRRHQLGVKQIERNAKSILKKKKKKHTHSVYNLFKSFIPGVTRKIGKTGPIGRAFQEGSDSNKPCHQQMPY